ATEWREIEAAEDVVEEAIHLPMQRVEWIVSARRGHLAPAAPGNQISHGHGQSPSCQIFKPSARSAAHGAPQTQERPNPLSGRLLMFDRAIVVAGIDCDPAWLRAPVLRDAKRSRTGQTVFKGVRQRRDGRKPRFQPTRTSIAASASTKLPMISMLDDLGWK